MSKVPDELVKGIDWGRTLKRLTVYAFRRLRGRATKDEAEEMATEALCQLFDPEYADWDHETQPVMQKLGSIVNGLVRNRHRVIATTAVDATDFGDPIVAMRVVSGLPGPEALSAANSFAKRAVKLIEEHIRGDQHCEDVFLLECDGISEPAAQAASLGVSIQVVYKARFRLNQARVTVRTLMRSEE